MLASNISKIFRRCLHNLEKSVGHGPASYTGSSRTHLCGTIIEKNVPVVLCGWLHKSRMTDQFWIVRDHSGLVQVLIPDNLREKLHSGDKVPLESVVKITGKSRLRPEGQENPNMPTGRIEIVAEDVEVLNRSASQLPFLPINHGVAEATRLQYRYLDFRSDFMQRNLRMRSQLISKMRQFLHDMNGFVDVETPYLFRRTPGGAREFIVPSQLPGKFYSLTQSPQQFKQLLMIGGIDRYFQIARCFRDESNNPEKQPEFTQLDLEMSFCDMESIIGVIEDLIVYSWPESLGEAPKKPFRRLKYRDAMNLYGSDKPDLRFGMQLTDLTGFFSDAGKSLLQPGVPGNWSAFAFVVPKEFSAHVAAKMKKELEKVIRESYGETKIHFLKTDTNQLLVSDRLSPTAKEAFRSTFNIPADSRIIICSGPSELARKAAGRIRLETANFLERAGEKVRESGFHFSWIVDFPLFARSDVDGSLETMHHPFTAPIPGDDLSDVDNVRGQHYDLVLNGAEVGGGSIRIHNAALQRKILVMLKIDPKELQHLLDALDSGCPPHGGIALGMDRLISILAGTQTIRDVIAYPKTAAGRDLMSDAPCEVPQDDLKVYHISVNKGV